MKYCLSLIILLLSLTLQAQINTKTSWGEVSQDEISLKQVDFEKEADVVILYEKGISTISENFQTHFYRRVKILTEKGIDFANQELSYYHYKGIEKITDLKGQTINFENGKTIISEIDKNSIYDINENEYYNTKRFAFPNVKVGSILEYKFTTIDRNIHHIEAWEFQHEYPTLFSEFTVENKMSLKYATIIIGDKITKQENVSNKSQKSTWRLYNLPSYAKINYVYNQKDMAERIIFQLSETSWRYSDAVKPITSWKNLKQERFDSYKEYINNTVGKEIANSIPKGSSEKETLENTFAYFKSNYVWNNFIGIYPQQNNRQVQKEKIGNQADLNLLLHSILKNSGFNTEIILLSSRSNGRLLTVYPYLGQFNMMVNLVSLNDGSSYIIDASQLNHELGFPPKSLFNHYAITIKPFDDNFIALKQEISEMNSLQSYQMKDGKFFMTRTDKKNGYFKESISNQNAFSDIENSLDLALNEIKKDKIDSNKEQFQLEKTEFSSNNLSQASFINIENPLWRKISEFKFTDSERERFLEFDFPFYYKVNVIVDIPEGYSVEIPKGFEVTHQTSTKQFLYNQRSSQKNNKLIIQFEFYLGKPVVTDKYSDVKSFFEKVNLDAQKTILLKKL